ncbi:ferritin-like domain-containing protein [Halothermothrix orenii]|uniref:Uncharacterized conserved protein n=1 Tax=Halothermothrix orenii (strain H 168 / OCM 544 / DSM 9562) TaxID=373903 RepID=B8CYH6_HALOH|nr:ferritin-like domain-containing protein [Halothermothrix orenii]ACL70345.1 uncharacterized conserved protein [Halothermothrix orenii H 168]
MANTYHEENLPEEAREFHRMIRSVIEELEAVDWYHQRAAVTNDPQLKAIVEHNRDEEIEHACMGLEWLRRKYPAWHENLKKFLFSEGDIASLEEEEENQENTETTDGSLGLRNTK